MAVVHMSVTLKTIIRNNADKKLGIAIRRAENDKPDSKWGEYIYNTIFGEYLTEVNKLPHWWFVSTETMLIRVPNFEYRNIVFAFSSPKRWPAKGMLENKLCKIHEYNRTMIILKNDPVWQEFFDEVSDYFKRLDFYNTRKTKFVGAVTDLCHACTTLNQAVKIWPPIIQFVGDQDEYKRRLGDTKVRKMPALIPDLDYEWMTSVAAMVRMEG